MKKTYCTLIVLTITWTMLMPKAFAFDKWGELNAEEAKTIVKLLDDVYKFWIVFDTRDHVENMGRIPSATVAKEVFAEMEKKGWHSARIVTATKNFFNPENRPKDDFEKEAVQALKDGANFFDRVEVLEGERIFRAATPVPLVMNECKMCHVSAKSDELLGALLYKVRLAK